MTTFTVGMHAKYNILTNDHQAEIAEAAKIPAGLTINSEPGGYVLSGAPLVLAVFSGAAPRGCW
jgi:hypothetical protein